MSHMERSSFLKRGTATPGPSATSSPHHEANTPADAGVPERSQPLATKNNGNRKPRYTAQQKRERAQQRASASVTQESSAGAGNLADNSMEPTFVYPKTAAKAFPEEPSAGEAPMVPDPYSDDVGYTGISHFSEVIGKYLRMGNVPKLSSTQFRKVTEILNRASYTANLIKYPNGVVARRFYATEFSNVKGLYGIPLRKHTTAVGGVEWSLDVPADAAPSIRDFVMCLWLEACTQVPSVISDLERPEKQVAQEEVTGRHNQQFSRPKQERLAAKVVEQPVPAGASVPSSTVEDTMRMVIAAVKRKNPNVPKDKKYLNRHDHRLAARLGTLLKTGVIMMTDVAAATTTDELWKLVEDTHKGVESWCESVSSAEALKGFKSNPSTKAFYQLKRVVPVGKEILEREENLRPREETGLPAAFAKEATRIAGSHV